MEFATPLFVTGDLIDPDFAEPFTDIDEQRAEPVPHRYVSGGFRGTNARFSFYFLPEEQYRGRFFHNTYPMATSSDIGPFPIEFEVAIGDLGFTLDSGAAYVQTNNGGVFRMAGVDPAIPAYRVNAAAAKYARDRGEHDLRRAPRLWLPVRRQRRGLPDDGGGAEHVRRVGRFRAVRAGLQPRDPLDVHRADACASGAAPARPARRHRRRARCRRQRRSLCRARRRGSRGLARGQPMGFPPRGWYAYETLDSGYFGNISGMMPVMDPSYAGDFFSVPGYLGSDPESSIHAHRFAFEADVVLTGEGLPRRFDLSEVPDDRDLADAHLVVLSGEAAGATLPIWRADGVSVTLIASADRRRRWRLSRATGCASTTAGRWRCRPIIATSCRPSRAITAGPVPRRRRGALYPQRPVLIGPAGTANAAGAPISGKVHGKVLSLACLLDIDSFAWQADWYRSAVQAAMGEDFDESFALYFVDNAHHENPMTPLARTHAVSYGGALQQALRDVAAWVEEGKRPLETVYKIADTQSGAARRSGAKGYPAGDRAQRQRRRARRSCCR